MKMKKLLISICCLLFLTNTFAQNTSLSGRVLSAVTRQPLAGASVMLKDTFLGTTTNSKGEFHLENVPSNIRTLIISYVGMESRQVKAENSPILILLSPVVTTMDEVIVTAYGIGKRSSQTGAIASLSHNELEKRTVTSATSTLLGNIAGVQSTLPDGQPGSAPSLRIRGFGSINASNEPLYIVDGTIYSGTLSDINPNDIASITLLKDAASTALYGSSAGNGVVQITTKRASVGDNHRVSLNISQGFSHRGIPEYDRVNLWDYYPLQWEMLKNQYISGSGQTPETAAANASANLYTALGKFNIFGNIPNDAIVLPDGSLNPAASLLYDDFDWEKYAYRNGYRADYTLSYSTKSEKSDTYASIGFLDDRGAMIQTDYKRYNARINYNIYPVKWLESGLNLAIGYAKAKTPMTNMTFTTAKGNMTSFLRRMAPIYPVHLHNPDGSYKLDKYGNKTYDYTSSRISLSGRHTIEEANLNKRGYTRDNYSGHGYLTIQPLAGLKISLNGSLESSNDRAHVYYNTIVADGAPAGRIQITNQRFHSYTFNQLINYQRTFRKHDCEILLGHENYDYTSQYQYVYKQKQIMEGLYELENFSTLSKLTSRTDTYRKEGYFLRANYNYDNTYFASVSYRRDGSSRFSQGARWGNFWSAGIAWRADQEEFIRNITWINMLKIRASYGETGNDGVLQDGEPNYYPWQTLYSTGINNSTEAGLYFQVAGNPNLKWETLRSNDIALEFRLFNRLEGTIEYFSKVSDNLLFDVPVSLSSGSPSIWQNLGKVSNKGAEITLSYDYLRKGDWQGSFGLNATFLKNKVKTMPKGSREIVSKTTKVSAGHSIYEFWLRDYWGVNPENGDLLYTFDEDKAKETPDHKITEINGKKYTNDATLAKFHYCGSAIPKVYGGFNTDLKYKHIQLSLSFAYGLGGKIYDANYADLMSNQIGYAMHKDARKAWRQKGDQTNVPRLDASQSSKYAVESDRFLINGDYLSLQSASISYDIPKKYLNPLHLENLSFALCGENLFQANHRKGINSLANFVGYTYNLYAAARTFTFNIHVTF